MLNTNTTKRATRKQTKNTPTAESVFTAYTNARKAITTAESAYKARKTKKSAKALATAQKRLANIEKTVAEIGVITAENVQTIAERIAVKALKTCLQTGKGYTPDEAEKARKKGKNPNASGNFNFLYGLYCGLIGDITERKNGKQPFSDGYDVAQTAAALLCGYIGKGLHDNAGNGETDKNGNPVDILRATFRAVNRYIMGERQREYKRAYVDDTDEHGNRLYYEIPDEWDIPTATDFRAVSEIIAALKLSQNEKRFLSYRMRGLSLDAIAQKMGIRRDTLNTYRKRVKDKARNVPALASYCNA